MRRLNEFKNFSLCVTTSSAALIQNFENIAVNEAEAVSRAFHRVTVFGWYESTELLFDTISEYFEASLVPVNVSTKRAKVTSFYTSNLCLILNIMKLDFMLPFARNMYKIEIIFNEKSSIDMFGSLSTLHDIVDNVVKQRFKGDAELDLSGICSDSEFIDKKIYFYKVSLLANFKLLMIRMANSTKILNLSRNKLRSVPQDILNFFITKDLTAINLSNNEIELFSKLQRVTSRIEKLWLEGNPLCEKMGSREYIKNVLNKFPLLTELDGVQLKEYEYGVAGLEGMLPFRRHYTAVHNTGTKLVVDKFLTLFFSFHDNGTLAESRLYDDDAIFTMMNDFTMICFGEDKQNSSLDPYYSYYGRNILCEGKRTLRMPRKDNSHVWSINHPTPKSELLESLSKMPKTIHDPATFTVDVLLHNSKCLILVVEGIYKQETGKPETHYMYFTFRRTFILQANTVPQGVEFTIKHDMLYVSLARNQLLENSFKRPIVNFDSLALLDPDEEDIAAITKAFGNITRLKYNEAEKRLRNCHWDIREALQRFMCELENHKIRKDLFINDGDFSNTSLAIDTID